MHNPSDDHGKGGAAGSHRTREQLVYVVPERALRANSNDEVDLIATWIVLWRSRVLIIAVTALFAVSSIFYALTLDHWYRAEVLLAPAEDSRMTGMAGQLSGIASLAGVRIRGDSQTEEAIAVLQSRDFIREFIEQQNLLPILYANQWNAEEETWIGTDPEQWPDMREAIKLFRESVMTLEKDRSTGLITLRVEWTDPNLTAEWATLLVDRLNEHMRERALRDAQVNVAYLRNEMSSTNVVALQESIGRLLESELQKLMLAKGSEEFAFRTIDGAQVPYSPSRPSRTLIVVVATLLGGVLSGFFVFVRQYIGEYRVRTRDAPSAHGRGA